MRLLFDQNISPKLVLRLADVFPHSIHVHKVGLAAEDDRVIWEYALTEGVAIVTKDEDFSVLERAEGLTTESHLASARKLHNCRD